MVFEKSHHGEGCNAERFLEKRQENQRSRPRVGPHTPESSPPHTSEEGHRSHGSVTPISGGHQRNGSSGASPIKGVKSKMTKGPDTAGENRVCRARGDQNPSPPRKSVADLSCKLQKPSPVNPSLCRAVQPDVLTLIALHSVQQASSQPIASLRMKGAMENPAVAKREPLHQPQAFLTPKFNEHTELTNCVAFKSYVAPSAKSLEEPTLGSSKPGEDKGSAKRLKPMQAGTGVPKRRCGEPKKSRKPGGQAASQDPGMKTPPGIEILPSWAELLKKELPHLSEPEDWRQTHTEMGLELMMSTSDDDIFQESPKAPKPAKKTGSGRARARANRAGQYDQTSPQLLCDPLTDRARIDLTPKKRKEKHHHRRKEHQSHQEPESRGEPNAPKIPKRTRNNDDEVKRCGDKERRQDRGLSGHRKSDVRSRDCWRREATGRCSDWKREALREARTAAILAKKVKLEKAFHWDCEVFVTVAKMMVRMEPGMEPQLQSALRKTLRYMSGRCVGRLQSFIKEYDAEAKARERQRQTRKPTSSSSL